MFRVQRIPENAVWNHPAVGQKDVGPELHRHHFVIDLDDDPTDPTPHTFLVLLVITIDFHGITYLEIMLAAGSSHIGELRHARSFRLALITFYQVAWRGYLIHHPHIFGWVHFALRPVAIGLGFHDFLRFRLNFCFL